ncbi:MAG: hypothetical protein ACRD1J_00600 [Terriglobia bacterium]
MCAKAVPRRCHCSLVADALLARGLSIERIMSSKRRNPDHMTLFCVVEGSGVTYPLPQEMLQAMP